MTFETTVTLNEDEIDRIIILLKKEQMCLESTLPGASLLEYLHKKWLKEVKDALGKISDARDRVLIERIRYQERYIREEEDPYVEEEEDY